MQVADDIRVTYLITTRNRAEYLERTLANIREFIEPQDELIIVDGLSTDHTKEVVERNRDIVTVFVSEKDISEAHAFNKGLFRARGRFLKPITDDDYFYPEAMRQLVQTMELNPGIDAIQCGGEVWSIVNSELTFQSYRFLPSGMPATPVNLLWYAGSGLGLIFSRTALEYIGGVSAGYTSLDGELICRLLESGCNMRFFDLNLYKWYLHSHSRTNSSKKIERDWIIFAIRLGFWDFLYTYDPKQLSEIANRNKKFGELSHLYIVWAVSEILLTKMRFLLYLPGGIIYLLQNVYRSFRRRSNSDSLPTNNNKSCSGDKIWTGILR